MRARLTMAAAMAVLTLAGGSAWSAPKATPAAILAPAAPQAVPSSGLTPGWYPDQNDHAMMRYYDGRVWTSETRSG